MKPFVVINPRAANGVTGRHLDTIGQAVRAAVGDHAHAFTERPMHAAELTRAALGDGCDLVIAVGGDGTINEVLNGFFQPLSPGAPAVPVREGAALAVLPRGTGGDFRRTLGLDRSLALAASRLGGEPRPCDVGRLDCAGEDGRPLSRLFLNVGEVGVGARVVEIANRSSKRLGGKLTFMMASLRALAGWRDARLTISFDDGPPEALSVTTLAIANGRYFGGGMMVAPGARLDDGRFDVTVWSGYTLVDFLTKSASMYDGTHVRLPGTKTRTATRVHVESADDVGIEIDGERVGRLPATFTVLPGAVRLVR